MEELSIDLILMQCDDSALDQLIEDAQRIWKECFPKTYTRNHLIKRSDVDVPRKNRSLEDCAPGRVTEMQFRKRLHAEVSNASESNSSAKRSRCSEDVAKPFVWNDSHEKELTFQREKLHKRLVDAHTHEHLLASDCNPALDAEAMEEKKRQASSFKKRLNAREKYAARTQASPPAPDEYEMMRMFFDDGLGAACVKDCLDALDHHGVRRAHCSKDASMFIAMNPTCPRNKCIALAAALRGAWVVSPGVVLGQPGPSIKYTSALETRRKIWVTPSFRQKHPWETLLLLELLSACPNRWTVLSTAQEWATAKALADVQKRPAEVIALVSLQHDVVGNAKHCFDLDQFLLFVCNAQPGKGSIGLLGM